MGPFLTTIHLCGWGYALCNNHSRSLQAHAIFDDQLHLRPCAGHDLFEYSHLFFCCLHQTSLHKGYHNQNAQIQEMEIYPDGHLHWYL